MVKFWVKNKLFFEFALANVLAKLACNCNLTCLISDILPPPVGRKSHQGCNCRHSLHVAFSPSLTAAVLQPLRLEEYVSFIISLEIPLYVWSDWFCPWAIRHTQWDSRSRGHREKSNGDEDTCKVSPTFLWLNFSYLGQNVMEWKMESIHLHDINFRQLWVNCKYINPSLGK